jgi:hypothetical protein
MEEKTLIVFALGGISAYAQEYQPYQGRSQWSWDGGC